MKGIYNTYNKLLLNKLNLNIISKSPLEKIFIFLISGVLHYFLNRFIMDGALRRLGRSIDFETSLGALGILEAVDVKGLAEALGVLATTELMEFFLCRTLPKRGIVVPLDRFDTLLDTGKELKDFLEITDSRLSPVGEIFPQILVPGAEFGACGDNLGLPAIVSEILK